MSEAMWFCNKGGQRLGPFPFAQLRQMASAGMIVPSDPVMRECDVGWVRADAVPDLFAPRTAPPVTAPDPGPAPPGARIKPPVIAPDKSATSGSPLPLIGEDDPLPPPVKSAAPSPRRAPPPLPSKTRDQTPRTKTRTPNTVTPLSLDDDSEPTEVPLADIAKWHRWLVRSALLYLLFLLADLILGTRLEWCALVLTLLTWPPLCFFLARALGRSPWAYAALAAVPLINLGVLIDLSGRASRELRAAGVRVGLLGGRVDVNATAAPGLSSRRRADTNGPVLDPAVQGTSVVPKWVLIGCAVPTGLLVLLCCVFGGLAYLVREADRRLPPVAVSPGPVPAPGRTIPVRRELSFDGGQVVFWSDDRLSDEARKLGEALRESGYFSGKVKKGVELSRSGDGRAVKVYLRATEIDEPRVQAMMKDYLGVQWAAIAFEDKPLTVALCDENEAERISYPIAPSSRYTVGPQCHVYHTSSLRAEAERFGLLLTRTGDSDLPRKWTLTKGGGKWMVCPGATTDAVTGESREAFRKAARQISDEVFDGQLVELSFFTKQGVERASAGR